MEGAAKNVNIAVPFNQGFPFMSGTIFILQYFFVTFNAYL